MGRSRLNESDTGLARWIEVAEQEDVAPGTAIVVRRPYGSPVAVFNIDGEFLAVDDTCTHAEYSRPDRYLDGDIIECALHMARFDLRTGEVLSLPAT